MLLSGNSLSDAEAETAVGHFELLRPLKPQAKKQLTLLAGVIGAGHQGQIRSVLPWWPGRLSMGTRGWSACPVAHPHSLVNDSWKTTAAQGPPKSESFHQENTSTMNPG